MIGKERALGVLAAGMILTAAGCELEEVTIVDPTDVVVAEVHLQIPDVQEGGARLTAFLHRTLGPDGGSRPVPGARVTVARSDGVTVELAETGIDRCVVTTPIDGTGTCLFAAPEAARVFGPGDTLTLRIDLAGGGVLRSQSVVPGFFHLVAPSSGAGCLLPPDTVTTLRWTASPGAWAYVNEANIHGLPAALAPRGIVVDGTKDPLYLLGLSVSAQDTTIVFPAEFGLFNRFELDQALALQLQRGLPAAVASTVTITAADRNYVNWVRGGNFNPSGQVRVPSIRGDGTGVFGTTVIRRLQVVTPGAGAEALPACPLEPR